MRRPMERVSGIGIDVKDLDHEFVKQALDGDRAAFDYLFERHKAFVYNVCCGMVGIGDDAADITQSTFIKAYNSLVQFRRESSFRTWVYRIAINLCIEYIRREKRRKRLAAEFKPEFNEVKNIGDRVREAMLNIDSGLRAVLVLFYFEGYSCREIGEILGYSELAVRSRLYRARKEFKGKYKECEP